MKNLLILASLLLVFSNNYSQTPDLFIKPSTSTDSYIYANDVVLYVENGISLELNNNPQTEASIYLRGDSQLIQGDKLESANSGNGMLSIWQRGTTNNFGYHNWSTPVGNQTLSSLGNTNFGINSYYDVQAGHPTHSFQQESTSSVNGTRDPLRISNRWIYVLRGQGNYSDWFFVGNSNGILPGDGFTMKGTAGTNSSNPQLYDFRGRPNDGTIDKGTVTEGVYVYLGNPYPSNIDMRDFLLQNPGIEGAVWYYEKSSAVQSHNLTEIQSGYGTWVLAGGAHIDAQYGGGTSGSYTVPTYQMYDGNGNPIAGPTYGSGTPAEARFAQVGQGFMVRGNANTTPVQFNNTMRRYVPAGYFNDFKNATGNSNALKSSKDTPDSQSKSVTDYYKVDASIRFHIEVNISYTRDMVLMFSANSTKGKDRGFDGRHPSLISTGDAFWKLEGTSAPYVIQTRPYDYYDLIPIHFRVKNGMNTFKINVLESYGLENIAEEAGHPFRGMYLYDQLNNQYQRLDLNNSATIYHSGGAGIIEDRYFIVFRRGIQEVASLKNAEVNVKVFQNNPLSKLQVSNPDMLDIKSASVYDMRGRLVINQQNIGKVPHYEFSTQGLSSGVYVVMLTTQDNQVLDYKVTIHNKN